MINMMFMNNLHQGRGKKSLRNQKSMIQKQKSKTNKRIKNLNKLKVHQIQIQINSLKKEN